MEKVLCMCLLLISVLSFNGQKETEIVTEKNYLAGNFLGTSGLLGLSYGRYIGERFGLEAGIGIIGIGGQVNYYPWKKKKNALSPFCGISASSMALVDVGRLDISYLPVGITWFGSSRIQISGNLGPAFFRQHPSDFKIEGESVPPQREDHFSVYGNLQMAIRF